MAATVNLGQLTEAVRNLNLPDDAPVRFADGRPLGTLASWRGEYWELTITSWDAPRTYRQFLDDLEAADGKTFEGYKGGDYTMGTHTAVYADDYGDYESRSIIGGCVADGALVLATFYPDGGFQIAPASESPEDTNA